jgi:osmotically-inducible protein OsmY
MQHISTRRWVLVTLTAATMASTLGGCVPLVVGGAVMTGMVATDRRTSGAQLDDEGIEVRIVNRLHEAFGDRVHVNATSYNRQVLLTGEVGSAYDKQRVEQIVSRVDNVRTVVNELALIGGSSFTQRSGDSVITGRVKAALLDAPDISGNAFKVVTERGAVYLMGRVTKREAERATEVVRGVGGVQKVVRVFEIISEAELQRIQTDNAPQPASTGPRS